MATAAGERDGAYGAMTGRWAWEPFAAVLVPALALLVTILIR